MITVRGWRPSLVVRDWRTWKPAKAPAPQPGHDRLRHQLRLRRGGNLPHLASHGNSAGLGGAPAHRRGRPRFLANATGLRLAPRAGRRQQRSTLLTPHGGEGDAPGPGAREALEEAEAAAARNAQAPGRVADTLSAAGRATWPKPPGASCLTRALAEAYGAVVALKGPVTFIASPDGTAEVMDRGTSALAKAGTGDVLAGIVGALLAQGLSPRDAAALGCALHAEAGRAAAAALTDICVSAEDLVTSFPGHSRHCPLGDSGPCVPGPPRNPWTHGPARTARPAPFAHPLLTRVNSESHRICSL